MVEKIEKKMSWPKGYKPKNDSNDFSVRLGLLSSILKESPKKKTNTEIFNVMSTRRSTRKFSANPVEKWKIDKILAAADTAPTAGNYQFFMLEMNPRKSD